MAPEVKGRGLKAGERRNNMTSISLTASMRSNLLSLQNISRQVSSTQNKLATGNKVNSAIDNPSSYYTARSLNNRADDLNALLDSMGQAVSTIKAANEGIESAAGLLEQMRAVTEQTLTEAEMVPVSDCVKLENNVAALLAEGYTAITKDMTVAEIQAILDTDNAKVVLTEDINLGSSVSAHGKNITINGGGHTLTFKGLYSYSEGTTVENVKINNTMASGSTWARSIYCGAGNATIRNVDIIQNDAYYQASAIELRGNNNVVENIDVSMTGNIKGEQLLGVYIWDSGTVSNVSVDITAAREDTLIAAVGSRTDKATIEDIGFFADGGRSYGIIGLISGIESRPVGGTAQRPSALYDGEANTQAIANQLGGDASAANAALQFTPDASLKDDADFGQGTWYVPAMGELMDMYGTDTGKMTAGWGSASGAVGDNKKAINDALGELEKYGIATKLTNGYYWSSSELYSTNSWVLNVGSGKRNDYYKDSNDYLRCFQLLENCFNPSTLSSDGSTGGGARAPKIGDVMYADKTWGSAADYDPAGGKIAVGIVADVDNSTGSVKLVNLKDLTFSSKDGVGNFDPENPYNNTENTTRWSTGSKMYQDVEGVDNYVDFTMLLALNPGASVVSVDTLNAAFARPAAESYQAQYNEILSQYDALINDASYKGINLLKGNTLNVKFNETGSADLSVSGKDISSGSIGLSLADWAEKEGILQSVQQLSAAVSQLRSYSAELGNNYNIITSRQDFTENLIDILTEGADKLTLADMNEESANMLALQTRQQLAINSLSLASQASQAVLKLF